MPDDLLFSPDAVFLQRFLQSGGYYKGDVDGDVGPLSLAALAKFQADSTAVAGEQGSFDDRTEGNVATLLLDTQRAARRFMAAISQAGLSAGMIAKIISGTRTYDEQDEIYAQGRTMPGKIVTHARAGESNHNFGIAWDVGIFDSNGRYIDDLVDEGLMTQGAVDAEYKKVGAFGKGLGLFWGGDWGDPDYPHFQMLDNDLLATVRAKFVSGQSIV